MVTRLVMYYDDGLDYVRGSIEGMYGETCCFDYRNTTSLYSWLALIHYSTILQYFASLNLDACDACIEIAFGRLPPARFGKDYAHSKHSYVCKHFNRT